MTSQRIVSSIIFFALFLWGLFSQNDFLNLIPLVFVIGGALWGIWEFTHLGVKDPPKLQSLLALAGGLVLILDAYFYSFQHAIILVGLLAVLTIAAGLPLPNIDIAAIAGKSVVAPLYVALPMALIVRLWRDNLDPAAEYPNAGAHYILFLVFVTWASDVGAYFAGRWFGRVKIVPRLSPGKTLEGYIGGAVLTLIIALAFKLFWNNIDVLFTWGDVIALALIFSFIGPMGDLCESQFKRSAHVKDSGWTFTGHGGMLDIIDSLLFTTIFYVAYLAIFYPHAFATNIGF